MKMPSSETVAQNQINNLENGLKNLKQSKLMKQKEFKDMYIALEKHQQNVRVAHLAHREKDLMRQAHQDTKFYFILMKMLIEVQDCQSGDGVANLHQVYGWYQNNKHVLHASPRFGKKKSEAPKSILKSASAKPADKKENAVEIPDQKEVVSEDGDGGDSDLFRPFSPLEIDNDESKTREISSAAPLPAPLPAPEQAPTEQKPKVHATETIRTPQIGSSALLPKRKPLPLSHLYNPLAHAPDSSRASEIDSASDISTPVRIRILSRDSSDGRAMRHQDSSISQSRKWDSFQKRQSSGQGTLTKLQYLGRSGMPGGVRYTAHENGLMAEDFTKDIIVEYARLDKQGKHKPKSHGRYNEKPEEQSLEEFYQAADSHSPSKLPKYPSFMPRIQSAPSATRQKPEPQPAPNRRTCSAMPSMLTANNEKEDKKLDVKLDTVVTLIDSVTDEMTFYKEKLAPDPLPGFRQPVVDVDLSQRPSTAPVIISQQQETPEEFESTQLQLLEAIDWRGKVTPDSMRSRWGQSPFEDHTYLKKTPATPQRGVGGTQRAVGGTHAGNRPITAPISPREKWNTEKPNDDTQDCFKAASHMTKEMKPEAVSGMMMVQRLRGGSVRPKSTFDSSIDQDEFATADVTPTPNMEYLSFVNPKSLTETHTGCVKRDHEESELDDMTGASGDGLPAPLVNESETDSLMADYDMPDLNDLDDDLDGMSQRSGDFGQDEPMQQDEFDPDVNTEDVCRADETTREEESADVGFREVPATPPSVGEIEQEEFAQEVESLAGPDDEEDININADLATAAFDHPNQLINEIHQLLKRQGDLQLTKVSSSQNIDPSTSPNNHKKKISFIEDTNKTKQQVRVATRPSRGKPSKPSIRLNSRPHNGDSALTYTQINKVKHPDDAPDVETDLENCVYQRYRERATSASQSRAIQRGKVLTKPFNKRDSLEENDSQPLLAIEGKGSGKRSMKMRARSAGTVPPRAKSCSHRRTLQKQQEMLKNTPASPYRTAPSIPSPFHPLGTRSPRPNTAYSSELEHHARRDRSPNRFLKTVENLRIHEDGSYLPQDGADDGLNLTTSLKVMKLKPGGSKSSPSPEQLIYGRPGTPASSGDDVSFIVGQNGLITAIEKKPALKNDRRIRDKRKVLDKGRPIPDYVHVIDPDEYATCVQIHQQAKAAVDIQRYFRGFVARSYYKYLLKDEREKREDKRLAAITIQKLYRGHLSRKKAIHNRTPSVDTIMWAKDYKKYQSEREKERQTKAACVVYENARNKAKSDAKLSVIGPHVEVYAPFHPKKVGPDKAILNLAATTIQKIVRGMLVRLQLDRLQRKSKLHASNWSRFVGQYKEQLTRVQKRHGLQNTQIIFDYQQVNDFMDLKKRYEGVFDKRAYAGQMEVSLLPEFIRDCDLFPPQSEVDEAFDAVFRGINLKGRGIQKHEALDIIFHMYPPKGTGLINTRKSTWINPIVEGEEAVKYLGSEGVEPTDFKTCWKLVAATQRERNERKKREDQKVKEEEDKRRAEDRRQRRKMGRENSLGPLQAIEETETEDNQLERHLANDDDCRSVESKEKSSAT